jgi:CBS-domain-containing membrane protein
MIAAELISNNVFALKKSDSADAALLMMEDFCVKQLPVVDQQKVLGFVNSQQLVNANGKVDELMQLQTDAYCIYDFAHLFEVLAKLTAHHFTTLAVIDNQQQYKGIINAFELVHYIHQHTALVQPGATIVLKMPALNYTLSEISRITESNDAKILAVLVQPLINNPGQIHVHLKLSKTHVRDVTQSFERFGYQIVFSSDKFEDDESLKYKLNWLLKYLNT